MISIITISYNSVNTISDTLKSIESQTMQDFEYIIVDGWFNRWHPRNY